MCHLNGCFFKVSTLARLVSWSLNLQGMFREENKGTGGLGLAEPFWVQLENFVARKLWNRLQMEWIWQPVSDTQKRSWFLFCIRLFPSLHTAGYPVCNTRAHPNKEISLGWTGIEPQGLRYWMSQKDLA